MAEPYRSQIEANPTSLAAASAESFGAAIGRGLSDAGAHIDHAIHTIKERDRDQEAASAGVAMAKISTELDQAAIDARANAGPGGAGHSEAVTKLVDERSAEALGQIKDRHIREAFTQRYAQLRDHIATREYGWEAGARVDKLATDVDDMGTTLANGAQANPDPVGLQVSLETVRHAIDVMPGLSADLKAKLVKEQQHKIAVGWSNAMQDKDPHLLVAALDKGLLNPYLQGGDVATLRSGGLVEIRRLEAAERQKKSQAEAEARETIGTLLNKVGDGYIPNDQEWKQAEGLATTYGLSGREWDLGVAKDKAQVNRETRTWTPSQWDSSIAELEAKGDKRTQGENVRLEHLKAARPASVQRFNANPYEAAAAAGSPAPAVDWDNPTAAQIEQHVTWAKSWARSAGLVNVPYLPPDVMKTFRERAAQGPAGQLETAATMRRWFGVAAATETVRQIDPNDRDMQLMVGLTPQVAEMYRRGAEALKAKTVTLGATPEDNDALAGIWQEYRQAIPVDLQPALLNATRSIAAGQAAQGAMTQPSGDELEDLFRMSIQRAGGLNGSYYHSNNSPGGFVRWRGDLAWLPPTMTRDDFSRRMVRSDKAAWIKAGGGEPYYQGPDGKLVKLNDSQIAHLPEYRLETVNPGVYRLIMPGGGHVGDKDGRPWQFDIRNLSPLNAELAAHGYVRR